MSCAVARMAPLGGRLSADVARAGSPITISYWAHNDPNFVAADQAVISRFEKAYPGIHVAYQSFPYDVYVRKL